MIFTPIRADVLHVTYLIYDQHRAEEQCYNSGLISNNKPQVYDARKKKNKNTGLGFFCVVNLCIDKDRILPERSLLIGRQHTLNHDIFSPMILTQ